MSIPILPANLEEEISHALDTLDDLLNTYKTYLGSGRAADANYVHASWFCRQLNSHVAALKQLVSDNEEITKAEYESKLKYWQLKTAIKAAGHSRED